MVGLLSPRFTSHNSLLVLIRLEVHEVAVAEGEIDGVAVTVGTPFVDLVPFVVEAIARLDPTVSLFAHTRLAKDLAHIVDRHGRADAVGEEPAHRGRIPIFDEAPPLRVLFADRPFLAREAVEARDTGA